VEMSPHASISTPYHYNTSRNGTITATGLLLLFAEVVMQLATPASTTPPLAVRDESQYAESGQLQEG